MTNEQLVSFPIKLIQTLVVGAILVVGVSGLWRAWQEELRAKQLYTFVPVTADSFSVETTPSGVFFDLEYTYVFAGQTYTGTSLSPFPAANDAARQDAGFREWITRSDTVDLVVYVNPENPAEASVLRGWVGTERRKRMATGGIMVSLSLMALYMILRPVKRVAQLFRT
ncbi:DUF3592 domain-containing protein [Lewinella sp. W8]|uniref:DUF3592 domain-containing protein n=1 Tax=Lewinella sp. W8 TaxID=2528208 RepID=UPI0010677DEB|nr:DUF3592 domain-containing protein [Lewinella sp. W8]MTB52312.1 DUF3592 domain-containing protein [Lewinella sp. W8]